MMKPVAIVGTGPSGLAAAQALKLTGVPMALFSKTDRPSALGGAQFLHHPIPYVNGDPDFILGYTVTGTEQEYQRKVYGDADVPFVSMGRVADKQRVPAWSLINTYEKLWDEFHNMINVEAVDAHRLGEWIEDDLFTAIIMSSPRPTWCKAHAGIGAIPHTFVSQRIRIMNECVLGDGFDNTIIYDGTPNVSWYRTSRINGVGSTEWGEGAPEIMPYKNLVTADKPIRTTCNCWSEYDSIVPVGRYGTWRKGELVHDAFDHTIELVEKLIGVQS